MARVGGSDGGSPVSPGDVIAQKYLVVRVLAAGGMGVVVEARHRQLQRAVAIKFLRNGVSSRDGMLARFEREARLIAGLKSEHVAKVFDIGRLDSGEPYIVMELLKGETLGDRMYRDGKLATGLAVSYVLEACDGLAEAHAAGIIHRDLKPDNLFICKLLDETESLKIIDFGISKAREASATITNATDVVGTPAYMAPEQLETPGSVDERADVWSLGVLLYEAVSGRRPFVGSSMLQMVSAVVQSEPTPIRDHAPEISVELAEIIHHCLKKNVNERFNSVADLARALSPFAATDSSVRLQRIEKVTKLRTTPTLDEFPRPEGVRLDSIPRSRREHDSVADTGALPMPTSGPPSVSRTWAPTPPVAARRSVLKTGLAIGTGVSVAAAFGLWGRRRGFPTAETSPASTVPAGTPIRVGVLHSLTGTMASSEASCVDAALLAIQRVNAAGGVLGRQVEALVRDGHSRADTFVEEATRLLDDDGVPVVFGCWTSTSRRAVRPVFEAKKRLLVYSVQYEGIEASPSIIYLGAAPNQQLIPAVRWAFAFLERKSFFLVGSDYVFPRVATEILKDQLRNLGAKIAGEAFLPLGSQNVSAVVEQIKKSGATMILNTINGDTNVAFIRELRAAGITSEAIPLLSFSLDQTGYRDLDPSLVAGDYMAWNYFESFDSQENHDFVKAMRDRFGPRPITDPMATTYSGVLLWADAVRRAGSYELSAVRDVLDKVHVSTPLGELRVNPQNQHAVKTIAIGQIAGDGKVQVVWSAPKAVEATPYPETRSHDDWDKLLAKLKQDWNGKWEAPSR
jgi:urea transport system substrate-binding protein